MLADDLFLGNKLYRKQFSEICKPLADYLGTTAVLYVDVDRSGRAFLLQTHQKWSERFLEEQYYKVDIVLVHPDNIHNGFAFQETSTEQEFKDTLLHDAVNNFGFCHSFVYIEKTNNNDGYFGLACASTKDNFQMINRLVNEAHIVKKIIRKINKDLRSVVKDLPAMKMDFATLKGEAFYKERGGVFNENYAISQEKKISLLKDTGLLTEYSSNEDFFKKSLSPQETNCLRIYLSSHNLKAVARDLNLSVSTVKTYIENIKNKFNCYTRHELLEKAAILESLGCL